MKKHIEIYIDKAQKKAIIVADREFLMDMRAANIAYTCHWIEQSKQDDDTITSKRHREISDKYSDYYDMFYNASEQLSNLD